MKKFEKVLSHIKAHKPFYIAFGVIFAFLFTTRIGSIFLIVWQYVKGDIYVTYEDFPTIGEWIQIVTTVLFSYLLLKATLKTNELSEKVHRYNQGCEYKNQLLSLVEQKTTLNLLKAKLTYVILQNEFYVCNENASQRFLLGVNYRMDYIEGLKSLVKHYNKLSENVVITQFKDIHKYSNLLNNLISGLDWVDNDIQDMSKNECVVFYNIGNLMGYFKVKNTIYQRMLEIVRELIDILSDSEIIFKEKLSILEE